MVSLITRPRPDAELEGLVYTLTPRASGEHLPLTRRRETLAVVVLTMTLVLNFLFF